MKRPSHGTRVLLYALAGGLIPLLLCAWLLGRVDITPVTRITVTGLLFALWIGFGLAVRTRVVRPLQTLANVLAALRQEDYSTDARGADVDDALGLVLAEANALRELLRERRLGALEAASLLRTVLSQIDAAIFAFDQDGVLRLMNRAAEALVDSRSSRAVGSSADQLGLGFLLSGPAPRTFDRAFPGSAGRWELRRGEFRQGGHAHTLVVLSDLSRVLREEERQAWQRLVRVLTHEINNSLAPISSIADTLQRLLERDPLDQPARKDARDGLQVIGRRADSLRRFMTAYARMAQLPTPRREPIDVRSLLERIARLEDRLIVRMSGGPEVTVHADRDQIEQVLINLVRNAVDAVEANDGRGGVDLGWSKHNGTVEIRVTDEGTGLADTANLFVPFFTTKPGGSGIGLPLSRQIAEAHGGTLELGNRADRPGCVARLTLPL
ncbi:MAG TPA: ATP-binding protein [Longimicrobiales bacterium]